MINNFRGSGWTDWSTACGRQTVGNQWWISERKTSFRGNSPVAEFWRHCHPQDSQN